MAINNNYSSSFTKVAIGSVVAVAMAIVIIMLVTTLSVSGAISRLTSEGYVVFAADEYGAIIDKLNDLLLESAHESKLFPDLSDDIDLTCTFTSGAIDSYGTWAEVVDSDATTFGSVSAANIHISALRIRTTDTADVLYVIELGYGLDAGAVTSFSVHEFGSGTKKIDSDEQVRFRTEHVPAWQKIYYRMKTENTLNAVATVGFRYHTE